MPHELSIKTAALPVKATGALVVYVAEEAEPTGGAASVWQATGLEWSKLAAASGFKGKQGQVLDLLAPPNIDAQRLLVLGSGKPGQGTSLSAWADRGGSLAAKLMALRVTKAAVLLDDEAVTPDRVGELAAGLTLRHYRFDRYKSSAKKEEADNGLSVTLHVANKGAADKAIADRMAVANGQILARDLMHEPPNVLGTTEFMERASELTELGLEVEVLDGAAMEELGMGALLAVAQGSDRPPYLVIMNWKGGKEGEAPLAFIGKGVVFDTGGISIKPGPGMEDMKGDMGGAACVVGLMHALAARKAKVNVVGAIGLVENMPDGNAQRPGDIVTSMSGQTIEIINTDAEGRLVLADVLWHVAKKFKPKFMVDLATLTGAIMVALGTEYAGMFSNNDELADRLSKIGNETGERVWRMPLGPEYDKQIDSQFADMKNTGGRHGGSITAAQFLQRFVDDTPWAHLDVAGTAMGAPKTDINQSWGSGYGVRLLDRLVAEYYETTK